MAEAEKGGGARKFAGVIDRIEDGGTAVVLVGDDGKLALDVPVSLLPEGASDGDHLQFNVTLDPEARRDAERRVQELQERLARRSGGAGKKDFKL